MKYILFTHVSPVKNQVVNLGDYIQTLAVEEFLLSMGVDRKDFIYFDRDALSYYNGEAALCIMNAWFSHTLTWFPSSKLIPVYYGTHFIKGILEHIKHNNQAKNSLESRLIGARDVFTRDSLLEMGLNSVYTGCLTLTFPSAKKKLNSGKTFIVDVPDTLYKEIPASILKGSVRIKQRSIGGYAGNKFTQAQFYAKAKARLKIYENEANVVITSALHCAAPCLALGKSVIFLSPYPVESDHAKRISLLSNFIPIYTGEDLASDKVEWHSVRSPDLAGTKKQMRDQLRLMVDHALSRGK